MKFLPNFLCFFWPFFPIRFSYRILLGLFTWKLLFSCLPRHRLHFRKVIASIAHQKEPLPVPRLLLIFFGCCWSAGFFLCALWAPLCISLLFLCRKLFILSAAFFLCCFSTFFWICVWRGNFMLLLAPRVKSIFRKALEIPDQIPSIFACLFSSALERWCRKACFGGGVPGDLGKP